MKHKITEKALRNIVKECLSEALKYNKDAKRYFPDYTGDPHSDAGKFASNNRGDFEYSHNDYKWSDPEKQKRFEKLQFDRDLEKNYFDPDRDNEREADYYLDQHSPDEVVERAAQEMSEEFNDLVSKFIENAKKRYPILQEHYYLTDFTRKLHDIIDDYTY